MVTSRRFIVSVLPTADQPSILTRDESHHALTVLRLDEGSLVEVLDGKGNKVCARLVKSSKGEVTLQFDHALPSSDSGEVVPVTLEIAISKPTSLAWTLEKAVELGAKRVVLLTTDHTQVRPSGEKVTSVLNRAQKIADQALKQCGRTTRLEIDGIYPLDQYLQKISGFTRLWCDESARTLEKSSLTPYLFPLSVKPPLSLLIGPEGGWSQRERELITGTGAFPIDLGPILLRCETAAIYALSLTSAALRNSSLIS